jgi:hypothetical protein
LEREWGHDTRSERLTINREWSKDHSRLSWKVNWHGLVLGYTLRPVVYNDRDRSHFSWSIDLLRHGRVCLGTLRTDAHMITGHVIFVAIFVVAGLLVWVDSWRMRCLTYVRHLFICLDNPQELIHWSAQKSSNIFKLCQHLSIQIGPTTSKERGPAGIMLLGQHLSIQIVPTPLKENIAWHLCRCMMLLAGIKVQGATLRYT